MRKTEKNVSPRSSRCTLQSVGLCPISMDTHRTDHAPTHRTVGALRLGDPNAEKKTEITGVEQLFASDFKVFQIGRGTDPSPLLCTPATEPLRLKVLALNNVIR